MSVPRLLLATAGLVAVACAGHALAQDHAVHANHASDSAHADHDSHAAHVNHASDSAHADHDSHAVHANHADDSAHPNHADHSAHGAHAAEEPAPELPQPTDADRAAAFPPITRHMQHAPEINRYLAFERLEAWNSNDANGQSWEVEGWLGSDLRRLWLRSEGRRSEGATHAANVELLYGRSVTPWWDLVAGVRHDFAPGRSQTRAAFGLQGLAPYGIELEATAHVGGSSRATLVVEAGYELLLTNRLVLEPVIEATFAASGDAPRGLGQGLSTVETGLRLRYEIDRRFAPYAGVVHDRAYGDTARLHRAEGTPTRDTRLVAGFRIWF